MKTIQLSLFFTGNFVRAIVHHSQRGRSLRPSASGQGNKFSDGSAFLPQILTDLPISALGLPLMVSGMHVSPFIFVHFSIWALT